MEIITQEKIDALRKSGESIDIAVENMLEILQIYQTNMRKMLEELEAFNKNNK